MAANTPQAPRSNSPRNAGDPAQASATTPPAAKRRRYSPKRIFILLGLLTVVIAALVRNCGSGEPTAEAPAEVATPAPGPVDCKRYPFKHFSKHLKDRLPNYKKLSQASGIAPLADEQALDRALASGRSGLKRVDDNESLMVQEMAHGHPYLTPGAHQVLMDIGKRFKERIAKSDVAHARLKVTSLLRTRKDQRNLGRSNVNATKDVDAPHTHGTSLDISYMRFLSATGETLELAACQQVYLAETLAEVIHEMRQADKRIFATREAQQACYHLSVCR